MFEIRTILCAVDFSGNMDQIIVSALGEARVHDAEVHILHVLPSPDMSMAMQMATVLGDEKYRELIREHKVELESTIRDRIEDLKGKALTGPLKDAGDRITGIHITEGDPVIEILEMTGKVGADMLVMGTHTKGMVEHTFFGNVARKVLKRSRVPVLAVPPVKE